MQGIAIGPGRAPSVRMGTAIGPGSSGPGALLWGRGCAEDSAREHRNRAESAGSTGADRKGDRGTGGGGLGAAGPGAPQ